MEEEVKQYLHIRYQWKGQPIIDADYLLDLYFRANYYPTDKLIDFLCYFYGYKITFPQSDVDFQVEKVLKDYPYKYLHPVLTKKLSVTSIVPFAEIYTGHMVLVSDESENIYGVYDDEILLYGKNYNKLINLLYRNEDKGKLSY